MLKLTDANIIFCSNNKPIPFKTICCSHSKCYAGNSIVKASINVKVNIYVK